jgi:hypothetical protein
MTYRDVPQVLPHLKEQSEREIAAVNGLQEYTHEPPRSCCWRIVLRTPWND